MEEKWKRFGSEWKEHGEIKGNFKGKLCAIEERD